MKDYNEIYDDIAKIYFEFYKEELKIEDTIDRKDGYSKYYRELQESGKITENQFWISTICNSQILTRNVRTRLIRKYLKSINDKNLKCDTIIDIGGGIGIESIILCKELPISKCYIFDLEESDDDEMIQHINDSIKQRNV